MVNTHSRVLFGQKGWDHVIFQEMGGTRGFRVQQNKSDGDDQLSHFLSTVELELKGNLKPVEETRWKVQGTRRGRRMRG